MENSKSHNLADESFDPFSNLPGFENQDHENFQHEINLLCISKEELKERGLDKKAVSQFLESVGILFTIEPLQRIVSAASQQRKRRDKCSHGFKDRYACISFTIQQS